MRSACKLAVLLLLLALEGSALAGSVDKPDCPAPISVGYYDAGVLYDEASGRGVDRDVIDELTRRSGCQFVHQAYPRVRIWQMIEHDKLDMTVSGIPTPERERFAHFVVYAAVKNVALVHKNTPAAIQSWDAFMADRSLSFGMVRSFKHSVAYDEQIAILRQQGRVAEVADVNQLFSDFKRGRFNVILSHPFFYSRYVRQHELAGQFSVHDWMPQESPVRAGLVLSRQKFSAAEAEKWRKLVGAMRKDGTLLNIFTNYLSKEDAVRSLNY